MIEDYFNDYELAILRERMVDSNILKLLKYFKNDTLACMVWFQKYADEDLGEIHPNQMHRRLANVFAEAGKKYESSKKENKDKLSRYVPNIDAEYYYKLLYKFKYVIPQGSVMSQAGTNTLGSVSNCFVIDSPYDSYAGIMYADQHLAQIMKYRGGVGMDISTLRPEGAKTSNVAKTSTGAVSFMERFSNTTREVAQGGRRGALMISISIEHPDVDKFIEIKKDLTRVTGANISVRLTDEFMEAVESNSLYCHRWPKNKKVIKKMSMQVDKLYEHNEEGVKGFIKWIDAKKLWDNLVQAAHGSAEPGILFWDRVLEYSPDGVYKGRSAIATNPCGEIPIPKNDSCRLIAVNLTSFVIDRYSHKALFDFKKFYEVVYDAMEMSDNLVDIELDAVDKIIDKIVKDKESLETKIVVLNLWENIRRVGEQSRRTGLGFTGLGDTAAYLGKRYGEEDFQVFLEKLMYIKLKAELNCSIDMAIVRGKFKGYDFKKEFHTLYTDYFEGNNDFNGPNTDKKGFEKLIKSKNGFDEPIMGKNAFYNMLLKEYPDEVNRMQQYGRRNISISTVAPTGSLSMLAQVSSGIEPIFKPYYMRRRKILSGMGDMIADFVDKQGDRWVEHAVIHQSFKEWIDENYPTKDKLTKERLDYLFRHSPWYLSTASDLDWKKRVETQALVQRYTTHSISSTINLPETSTVEDVNTIYMKAWKDGLKGITVYREGSRDGVLIASKDAEFKYNDAIKRPKEVKSTAYTVQVSGEKYSVFVGLVNKLPYEVFAYVGSTKEGEGFIVKEGSGEYYYRGDEDDSRHRILTGKMTDEQEVVTRLISGSLRHGRDIKFISEDLSKTSGSLFSFNSAIARVLKRYIKNGTKAKAKCLNPDCTGDGNNVIYEEGCSKCLDCGSSKCG